MSRATGVFHSDIGEQPLPRTMYMSEIHGQEELYRLAQDYDLGDATGAPRRSTRPADRTLVCPVLACGLLDH